MRTTKLIISLLVGLFLLVGCKSEGGTTHEFFPDYDKEKSREVLEQCSALEYESEYPAGFFDDLKGASREELAFARGFMSSTCYFLLGGAGKTINPASYSVFMETLSQMAFERIFQYEN